MHSFFIALAMYSKIPVPNVNWNEKNMRYAMCFFPVIGIVIGLVIYGSYFLFQGIQNNQMLLAAMFTIIPILITGGIHFDGYLDVIDALSSYQSKERRLEILKDPHTGAFAIIYGGVYFVMTLGLLSIITYEEILVYMGVFVLSRGCSAFAVVSYPKAKKDGTVSTFSQNAQKKVVQVISGLWMVSSFIWVGIWSNLMMAIVIMVVTFIVMHYYYRLAIKQFGGTTGDLAGYFVQILELVLLGCIVIFM